MPARRDRLALTFRWAARVFGTLVAAFWLFIGVVSPIHEPLPVSWESWVMAALMISAGLAVGVAWWREGPAACSCSRSALPTARSR